VITIRREKSTDPAAVRRVLEGAFGRTDEASAVEALRARQATYLSLVALKAELVVGHILFTVAELDPSATPQWIEAAPEWLDASKTPAADPAPDEPHVRAQVEVPWLSLEDEWQRERREAEALAAAEAAAQQAKAAARKIAVDKALSHAIVPGAPVAPYVALGPMGVHPKHQQRGIGARLVETGLQQLQRAGVKAVFVLGHPEYYPKFGFTAGRYFGIGCEFSVRDDAFMARELEPGCLGGLGGVIRFAPELSALG
jgi:predicted N-acetyltransferase YhbS